MPRFFAAAVSASTRPGPPPQASTVRPPQNLNLPSTLKACRPQIGWKRTPLPRSHFMVSKERRTRISQSSGWVRFRVTRNMSSKNWSSV